MATGARFGELYTSTHSVSAFFVFAASLSAVFLLQPAAAATAATPSPVKLSSVVQQDGQNNYFYLTDSKEITRLMYLGEERIYAASSCKEIATIRPNATSGYYYITGLYVSPQDVYIVYCDLEHEFVDNTRGWMRIGLLNPAQTCPSGFEQYRLYSKRLCRPSSSQRGCTSVRFRAKGIMWRQICGKIIVHYHQSTDGFLQYGCSNRRCSLNEPYVDGVSITSGNRYMHVWTVTSFATPSYIPNYVGNNFGTGSSGTPVHFCTELVEPLNIQENDIYASVCRDQARDDEDVAVELIELYVR